MDEIEGLKEQSLRSESVLEVLSAAIGALAAGRSGELVHLPIDPNSDLGREEWSMS